MAQMITRTISTNHVTAYQLEIFEGAPHVYKIAEADVQGTKLNETQARAALRAKGFSVPRNCTIQIEETAGKVYGMSVEDFMKYAHEITQG